MMDRSEEEMDAYVEGFRARGALKEERRRQAEAAALKAAERWGERLRSIPEVRRVILYGSLAKGSFQPGSDIDHVVEGLPSGLHFRIWSELEREGEFDLDLQRWEELTEDFREVIATYGRVLYERP